jgi:hypothetical protein
MTGRRDRLDPGRRALGLHAVALGELGVARDVIVVRMRRQQAAHVEALALDDLVQRSQRRPAVDEERFAALLVPDEERVREPLRVHAALDSHRRQ